MKITATWNNTPPDVDDYHSFSAIVGERGLVTTVHRIRAEPAGPTLAAAVAGYLATLDHPETAATRRVYAGTLAALCATLDAQRPVADLAERAAAEQLAAWFTGRWGARDVQPQP